jgi:hypothetical protein
MSCSCSPCVPHSSSQHSYPWQALKLFSKALHPPTNHLEKRASLPLLLSNVEKSVENTLSMIHTSKLPFTLYKKPSSIANAGLGVYLHGTSQPKGTIVSFYPGTIYMPSEPVLFVGMANQYILKCVDGLYVDGKCTGLSASVYRSLYRRENWPGAIQISDMTWLSFQKEQLV